MQKKRVGVITFHNYDNYGAILQSYALQKKLQEIGTQPEIIDYRCDYISNPLYYIVLWIVFSLKLHYFFTIFHYFIVFANELSNARLSGFRFFFS